MLGGEIELPKARCDNKIRLLVNLPYRLRIAAKWHQETNTGQDWAYLEILSRDKLTSYMLRIQVYPENVVGRDTKHHLTMKDDFAAIDLSGDITVVAETSAI